MPTAFVLLTKDSGLVAAWRVQIPEGCSISISSDEEWVSPGRYNVPLVIVVDILLFDAVQLAPPEALLIVVGGSEVVRDRLPVQNDRVVYVLSYEDSRSHLHGIARLVERLAERSAALDLLRARVRHDASYRAPEVPYLAHHYNCQEMWDLMDGVLENLASRERLLSEIRRASRYLLNASHILFLLRVADGFRADHGGAYLGLKEPLVAYLTAHPVVLDGIEWPGPEDPLIELSVRNRLALWSARLLIPLHDSSGLVGLIVCGVRNDGKPYDSTSKNRATLIARFACQILACCDQFNRLRVQSFKNDLSRRYLPRTLLLGADEDVPRDSPIVVRTTIGKVRNTKMNQSIVPGVGQPFRVSAGVIAETSGVWAFWEDASDEVFGKLQEARSERLGLLREIALTLNHEISNSLVSLMALEGVGSSLPKTLQDAIRQDILRLNLLNDQLVHLSTVVETTAEEIDLRELIVSIGANFAIKSEVGPDPVVLPVAPKLLGIAIETIVRAVLQNQSRGKDGDRSEVGLQLRSSGTEGTLTALLSIQGQNLVLEGILPKALVEAVPNQGQMEVFVAKEILKLHRGSIHSGPGLEGTEILISIRKW